MKKYIETVIVSLITGAAIMQITNMAVKSLINRELHIGGEVILPVLLGLVAYLGWNSATMYFKTVRQQEVFQRGFDEGAKIHSYKIVIPMEADTDEIKM